MAAGSYNVLIEAGATFSLTVTYTDAGGTPINLTGYTARMQIRDARADAVAALELNTTNGRIVITGATGLLTLSIAAVDTALLDMRSGVYDLIITSAGGVVTRLLEGFVTVSAAITV